MATAESKLTEFDAAETPVVRVLASAPDPYVGLKGHAYIAARKLARRVQRVQTFAHVENSGEKKAAK
jgi:hypothetical protein